MPTRNPDHGATSRLERAAAAGLLLVTAPLLAAGAVAARADGGPALFRQERVGQHRRSFVVWKLRTMRDGCVTPAGRWLRRTKLDELPQLVNVARGEMRFVGPRPITRADVERLDWAGPWADARWSVPPGITGPTQLSPVCDAERALVRDVRYASERSRHLDARILARTLLRPLLGPRAALPEPKWR